MTPYEQAMEDLALKLAGINRHDSALPATTPPTGDDEDDQDQPAKRRR